MLWGFSSVVSRGYPLVAVCGLLTTVASPVAEHRFWGAWALVVRHMGLSRCGSQVQSTSSVAVVNGLSKSMPQPVMLKKLKLNGSMKTYKTF